MKVGLIGYGRWGGGPVARNIARVADLAVIVDPDPVRMVQAAEDWGVWGTRVASEPEVAFDRCDAVWIATPAVTHFDLTRQALEAGVHVLCEKPFVLDPAQAEELAMTAAGSDLALMVGHLSLFTEAHRWSASRKPIHHIETFRRTIEPSLSDHNVIWGLGPHDVAFVWSLMGMPDMVTGEGTSHRAVTHLQWVVGGWSARIEVDWLSRARERCCTIHLESSLGHFDEKEEELCEPLLMEAEYFLRLVAEPELRQQKLEEAVAVTEILDRVNSAARTGRVM